jgi:hypothetical protein
VRILLDENLPVDLAAELAGHEVTTVTGLGWQGIKNSELMRRAQGRFDALVTMDRNLEFQQNIAEFRVSILVLLAPSNRMVHLRPHVPGILKALKTVQPGELRRVGT